MRVVLLYRVHHSQSASYPCYSAPTECYVRYLPYLFINFVDEKEKGGEGIIRNTGIKVYG